MNPAMLQQLAQLMGRFAGTRFGGGMLGGLGVANAERMAAPGAGLGRLFPDLMAAGPELQRAAQGLWQSPLIQRGLVSQAGRQQLGKAAGAASLPLFGAQMGDSVRSSVGSMLPSGDDMNNFLAGRWGSNAPQPGQLASPGPFPTSQSAGGQPPSSAPRPGPEMLDPGTKNGPVPSATPTKTSSSTMNGFTPLGPNAARDAMYGLRPREDLRDWAYRVSQVAPAPAGLSTNGAENPMASGPAAKIYESMYSSQLPWQMLLQSATNPSANVPGQMESLAAGGPSTMSPQAMQALSAMLERYQQGNTAGMTTEQQGISTKLLNDPISQAMLMNAYLRQRTGGFGADEMGDANFDLARNEVNNPLGPQAQAQAGPFLKRMLARSGL